MGIEKITEKILADAQEDARRIFEKGRYDRRDIESRAKRKAEQLKNDALIRGEKDGEILKQRYNSSAELEGKKLRLEAKQELIGRAFERALEDLAQMEEEKYLSLLEKALKETSMMKGQLSFNEKDRAAIGEKLVRRVSCDGKQFDLSGDTISAKGGFVLRDGAIEINCTLETMVNAVRQQVTPQVVEVLFG